MKFDQYPIFESLDVWPLRIPHADYAPRICGVYMFIFNETILYIGSSKLLQKRLCVNTHAMNKKLSFSHEIYIMPCYDYQNVEVGLIKYFKPMFNKMRYNKTVLNACHIDI
jgi:excinuclease UvrABC nuclease subunit